jgi:hypothetical protein
MRWLWVGLPAVVGVVMAVALIAIDNRFGVRIHPYLVVAAAGLLAIVCLAATVTVAEMFWVSYALEPLVDDPAERERIVSDRTWWHQSGLKFRNREFGIVAPLAFAGGVTESGRVVMRALYLDVGPPTMWERLWLRYWLRGKPA